MKSVTPRKRFGQHFLVDNAVLDRIVESFNPKSGECIVEIGPGTGALTSRLLEQISTLTAIELDRDLTHILSDKFGDRLIIHQCDVLKFNFSTVLSDAGNQTAIRLIGNLPYNISTPLLIRLATDDTPIVDMVYMLQKEVAQRIAAQPGSKQFGRLTVMLGARFRTDFLFDVHPESFDPPPKVQSSVVRISPLTDPPYIADHTGFEIMVRQAFSQRRKTIQNALKSMVTREDFSKLGIDSTLRAENLSVQDFVRLSNYLHTD